MADKPPVVIRVPDYICLYTGHYDRLLESQIRMRLLKDELQRLIKKKNQYIEIKNIANIIGMEMRYEINSEEDKD